MTEEPRPVADLLAGAGALPPDSSHDAVEAWLLKLRDALASEPPRRRGLVADAAKERVAAVEVVSSPATLVTEHLRGWSTSTGPVDSSMEDAEVPEEIAEQADELLFGEENLLEAAYSTMQARGLVGEKKNAQTLFLAGVGGCLGDPIHVALQGDSSSGKNEITRRVLELLPQEMVYRLTGMSTHALEYRGGRITGIMVIQEVHGQTDAQYQLREAMSEGRLTRWTVDEGEGGGMEARELEVEIDASIVTTTTSASLHPENATRVFSLEADSSAEQTRAVLDEIGARAARPRDRLHPDEDEDVQVWREAIRRLGSRKVVVPFGPELSTPLPDRLPRARRDVKRVLALVRASALLHQRRRDVIEGGVLLASVDDYAAVHPLLDEVLEPTMSGLTDTAREIIDLHNELADDGPGGWVKRADLEDEAGRRDVASPNTVRKWAKQLSKEGIWKGERREHNAWWHRQVHDPDSGAVNLPSPISLIDGGKNGEGTKGTNTPQTRDGNRKARHDGKNGEGTKSTNGEGRAEGTPDHGGKTGNLGNESDHPGDYRGDDLPPPDCPPLVTAGTPEKNSTGSEGGGEPATCRDCDAETVLDRVRCHHCAGPDDCASCGGDADGDFCLSCREELEASRG